MTNPDPDQTEAPGSEGDRPSGAPVRRRGLLRRWLPMLILVAILGGIFQPWNRAAPAAFASGLTVAQANAQAAAEGKVVVAVVTSRWCAACQVFKRTTLVNDRVEGWLSEHAVPVFLVWEDEEEQVDQLGVYGVPTTIILDGGEIIASHTGAMTPSGVLELFEAGWEKHIGAAESDAARAGDPGSTN